MKVIMLTRRAWPHIGGVEKHILEISKILENKKHKVEVINEESIGYPKVKILGLLFIWFWMVRKAPTFAKADIIHAHDVAIWYLPLRILLFWKPFYVTFHGWEGKFPIPLRYKLLRKISAAISNGNICVGRYIEKWYGIKASYIIHGAIAERFKNKALGPKSGNDILVLGRLQEDTGVLTYLQAISLLKKKYPRLKVLFLGDGLLRIEAEKYGKVLGFKKDVLPYLSKSIFVLTSGYLSMLEAMSLGKVAFATYNNPIKKDILKMSPFSKYAIIEKDPEKMAVRIEYFLKHGETVPGAIEWAGAQTWEYVVEIYLKLWRIKG